MRNRALDYYPAQCITPYTSSVVHSVLVNSTRHLQCLAIILIPLCEKYNYPHIKTSFGICTHKFSLEDKKSYTHLFLDLFNDTVSSADYRLLGRIVEGKLAINWELHYVPHKMQPNAVKLLFYFIISKFIVINNGYLQQMMKMSQSLRTTMSHSLFSGQCAPKAYL